MGYVTAALAIYGAVSAYDKQQKSKKAIEKLKKNKPVFRSAEDIQNEAEMKIQEGYSPQERANFFQQLARSGNAAYSKATQVNPNLSSQVQSGINYLNVGALSNFSARDAALRRQRIQDYVGLTRGQSNAQTTADIQSKRDQEIAYGNAKNQADAEIFNSLSMLGYGVSNIRQGDAGTTTPTQTYPRYYENSLYGQPNPPQYNSVNTPPGDPYRIPMRGAQPNARPANPYYSVPSPPPYDTPMYFGGQGYNNRSGAPYSNTPYYPY